MKMKKCSRNILIIGVDSQIGSSLQKTLKYNNFNVFGTTRRRERVNSTTLFFDLANPIIDFHLSQFDTVVICASITEIQKCEQEAEKLIFFCIYNSTDNLNLP